MRREQVSDLHTRGLGLGLGEMELERALDGTLYVVP